MINRQFNPTFTFVGAGSANLILITHLLGQGVDPKQITLIGDQKGGAFANELSAGSSVPGNTRADAYKNMYAALYKLVPVLRPPKEMKLALDSEMDEIACTLDVASGPLRYIAERICGMVNYEEGRATKVKKAADGYHIEAKLTDGSDKSIHSHQVILGIGGRPRAGKLPTEYKNIQILNPNDVFIESTVRHKFANQKLTVAVIGSSHSAALATMHLLEAGHSVIQFMDKEYLYAETVIHSDGSKTTKFDDTGLKGNVAHWTKGFLKGIAEGKSIYQEKYQRHLAKDRSEVDVLLQKHLKNCTSVVFTIGYDPAQTLEVDGLVLSRDNHDSKTMQFRNREGLWGFGLAFAETVNNAQSNGLTKYHASAMKLAPRLIDYANKEKVVAQLGLFKPSNAARMSSNVLPMKKLRSSL